MNNSFLNTLERHGETLAVRDNAAKRRKAIQSNLVTTSILLGFAAYAWSEHSVFLIVINAILCVMTLPLTLLVLVMETRAAARGKPGIEIDRAELRFQLASTKAVSARPDDIRELILMPGVFGQTLIVIPADERAFGTRLSALSRFYVAMSKRYCGHHIGLTVNLNPAEFEEFTQALEHTFPNHVSVMQEAHQPPLLARLLGNHKRPVAAMPAHIPPPLVKL